MMIDNKTLYQMGQTYLAQNRYTHAEKHFLAALAGYRLDLDDVGQGNCRNGLGEIYFHQGRHLDVWAEFWQGLTCHQAANQPLGAAASLTGLGLVLDDQGQVVEAAELFQEALALRRDAGQADENWLWSRRSPQIHENSFMVLIYLSN